MSRELKFRAWWKHPDYMPEGEMYYVGGLSYIVEHEYEEPEKDFSPKVQSVLLISGPAPVVNKGGWNDAKYVTLMQFTGLKDKKGKEIYEGDLVQGKYRHEPQEVFWVDDHACFSIGDVCTKRPGDASGYWEIVGNIYENPELLNK